MQKKNLLTIVIVVIIVVLLVVLLATNHKVNEKDKKIEHLEQIENCTETDYADTTYPTDTNTTYTPLKTVELSTGSYRVPDNIAAGTYNVSAKSGYGLLTGDFASGYISTTIGYDSSQDRTNTYSNLKLSAGDEFKIESNCTMVFTPR